MTRNLNYRLARHAPAVLSLFRLVYGLLFAGYGSMILFGWPVRPAWPVPVGAWPGWYAGLIELVAGLLIAAGLFTRAAGFIASGEMAVAYFWMHQPRSLWPIGDPPAGNGGTLAILFCFGFFLLVFMGGGSHSIDARRGRPRR
jgi:putative oxidoreductase